MNTQFRMFHGGTFQMRWQASLPIDALSGGIHRVGSGDQAATVRWNPRRQSFVGVLFAAPLRGLAFAAGLMATGFAALARSAASMASRAQGCISTGDSMASSGALK